MTATGHAIVGVVIAAKIANPYIAIPLAIGSHVICDLFPHWDVGTHFEKKSTATIFEEGILDVVISMITTLLMLLFIFPTTNFFYAVLMVFMAQLLDWGWAPYSFLGWKFPPFSWLYRFSFLINVRLDKPWGIINQVLVLVLLVVVAKLY